MGRTSHRYSEDAQRRSRAFRGRWHRTQSTRGKKRPGKPNLSHFQTSPSNAACAILRHTALSLPSRRDLPSPGIASAPGTLLMPLWVTPVVKHGSGFNLHH